MTGMSIGLIIAVILLILAFKFLKSIIKGIVVIALIVIIILLAKNYFHQNFSLEQLPSFFQTQLQEHGQETSGRCLIL